MRKAGQSYLLDTNVAIWLDQSVGRITPAVWDILGDEENRLWVSTAAFWEIAIKQSLGAAGGPLR